MWVEPVPGGSRVSLLVVPGASREQVVGLHDDALRMRVAAPPEKGRANGAVIALLAKALGIRRGDIEITAGHGSRRKTAHVRGVTPADVRRRLGF